MIYTLNTSYTDWLIDGKQADLLALKTIYKYNNQIIFYEMLPQHTIISLQFENE